MLRGWLTYLVFVAMLALLFLGTEAVWRTIAGPSLLGLSARHMAFYIALLATGAALALYEKASKLSPKGSPRA